MGTKPRRTLLAAVVVATVLVVPAIGSLVYWVGEGRPRSPAAFRELIAASGLVVDCRTTVPGAVTASLPPTVVNVL